MKINEALFQRFLANECSLEELQLLYRYFDVQDMEELSGLIDQELHSAKQENSSIDLPVFLKKNREVIRMHMNQKDMGTPRIQYQRWKWLASIAALLVVALGIYVYQIKQDSSTVNMDYEVNNDINPGRNTATLRLANGQVLALQDDSNGLAVGKNGQINYADGKSVVHIAHVQQVILETPRAGQYKVSLPDGTHVWLNADTKLEYPNKFVGLERRVKLVGEAYFEVAEDKSKPFIIESNQQEIRVLGTTFNVQAYPSEKNTTTLLEGKLKVRAHQDGQEYVLNPNQQTIINKGAFDVNTVNTLNFTAWKDGYFRFKASPLVDVLKQLERWYDLEINYEDIPEDILVHFVIKRDKKLSSVIYAIEEMSNLKFKLTGRRLELM